MLNKVVVIGSGFSGLSVATFLSDYGFDVTIVEKHDQPGGRARKFTENGFTFDMGPSWYWMPDVFERYFESFDTSVSDFYQLERLDPSYRIFFEGDQMDVPAQLEGLYALFEKIEPGSSANLKKFLRSAAFKYKVGIENLVYKPSQSLLEFADLKLLHGMFKLNVFKPISKEIRGLFKDKRLIDLLEFPVLFLGAKPSKTPALYSLMNYADLVLGTWYPKGGMHKIIEGMYQLALQKGVKFLFNFDVKKIEVEHSKAVRIVNGSGSLDSDVVISSADYHFTDSKLLDRKYSNYSDTYWESRVMAPSSIIYYLGIDKKLPGLLHHNLFFDKSFEIHSKEIYDEPQWPSDPQFYVSCTSVTDVTVAPEGCENIFILIPVASGLKDDDKIKENYFNKVISRIEDRLNTNIKDHIIVRRDFAYQDFISEYNSFKGNAYGLANTLKQTAILKPSLKNKKVKNLYYTGQLTVPGPGVPPSLISGEVVAKEIIKTFS